MSDSALHDFDIRGLFEALDARRVDRGLSWSGVADELWNLSAELNARRNDHPISPATLTGMAKRGATSCQHALFMLRWLGRAPESFLPNGASSRETLPAAGPDRRLRWDLSALHEALDGRRRAQELTWPQLARQLRCTPSQLTGVRTARFAIDMNLAMKAVQWLQRPAADFIHPARW